MSNELTKTDNRQSALQVMATKFSVEPTKLLSTLKNTAFKGASDDQMLALCVVANEYGLNPFTKEIYAFPDKGGGIVPVIGVDGWYAMVNAQEEYDGCEFSEVREDGGNLVSITCKIHRKDREFPTVITEYLEECKRNTDPWKNQPTRMLRHRSFVQCARIAFAISGSDPEDAERAEEYRGIRNVTPKAELEAGKNPFEKKPIEEPATLESLMERDGYNEAGILQLMTDTGFCDPEIGGLDDLTESQRKMAVQNWESLMLQGKGEV